MFGKHTRYWKGKPRKRLLSQCFINNLTCSNTDEFLSLVFNSFVSSEDEETVSEYKRMEWGINEQIQTLNTLSMKRKNSSPAV